MDAAELSETMAQVQQELRARQQRASALVEDRLERRALRASLLERLRAGRPERDSYLVHLRALRRDARSLRHDPPPDEDDALSAGAVTEDRLLVAVRERWRDQDPATAADLRADLGRTA